MKAGGSKEKGAEFERFVAKRLSLWVSEETRDDLFWRSAMSGGRATLQLAKGKKSSAQAGDLSSIHPLGHTLIEKFMVECKFYKTLRVDSLIFRDPIVGTIYEIWMKVRNDALAHDKNPMLIARQNFKPTLIGLNDNGVRLFFEKKSDAPIAAHFDDLNLYLLDFERFLDVADPVILTGAL